MKSGERVIKHREKRKSRGFKRKEIEVTIEDGLLTPRTNGKYPAMKKDEFNKRLERILKNADPLMAELVYSELYQYFKKYLRKSLVAILEKEQSG